MSLHAQAETAIPGIVNQSFAKRCTGSRLNGGANQSNELVFGYWQTETEIVKIT